jgi:hypothetical protein
LAGTTKTPTPSTSNPAIAWPADMEILVTTIQCAQLIVLRLDAEMRKEMA